MLHPSLIARVLDQKIRIASSEDVANDEGVSA
jgi:hypothetical protein